MRGTFRTWTKDTPLGLAARFEDCLVLGDCCTRRLLSSWLGMNPTIWSAEHSVVPAVHSTRQAGAEVVAEIQGKLMQARQGKVERSDETRQVPGRLDDHDRWNIREAVVKAGLPVLYSEVCLSHLALTVHGLSTEHLHAGYRAVQFSSIGAEVQHPSRSLAVV